MSLRHKQRLSPLRPPPIRLLDSADGTTTWSPLSPPQLGAHLTIAEKSILLVPRDEAVLDLLRQYASIPALSHRDTTTWRYPSPERLENISVWTSSRLTLIVLDAKEATEEGERRRPRLRHQDAATNAGHGGREREMGIEYDLLDELEDDVSSALERVILRRWTTLTNTLRTPGRTYLWDLLLALESNASSSSSPKQWTLLIDRITRRLQLTPSHTPSPPTSSLSESSTGDPTLDRIAYLGGLLLPVTVVSGVLSIEGDYGPEGGNFWVFWVASAIASLVAVLVIYVDSVRVIEVWVEVEGMADGWWRDVEGGEFSGMSRERERWEKRRLGWKGAVKRVSGYDRLRGNQLG